MEDLGGLAQGALLGGGVLSGEAGLSVYYSFLSFLDF